MVMKRKDMLKGMKMPEKMLAEKEAEMDLGLEEDLEELPEDDMEMDLDEVEGEEVELEDEELNEEDDLFGDIDDDMLIEEMKKRGLSLDKEEEEEEIDEEDLEI